MKAIGARKGVALKGVAFLSVSAAIFYACSPGYNNISTPNGQLAIIQQAGDDITAGDCQQALSTLQPLIDSSYANYDAWITESSAYACEGGLFFPAIIGNLRNGGSDIWSLLIASDPSSSLSDGHRAAMDLAEQYLRQTATPAGVFPAANRTSDANMYMVFQQLITVALTIAPLGNANQVTGAKGNSITFAPGAVPITDECHMEVAFATISDSLSNATSGSIVSSVGTSLTQACANLPTGTCPTTLDYTVCLNGGADTVSGSPAQQGLALFAAVDAQWN